MANLWSVAREWFHKQNPRRNITPRKISTVLEILQTQEEAKDHVYYDALRRISASKVSWLSFSHCLFLWKLLRGLFFIIKLIFNVRFVPLQDLKGFIFYKNITVSLLPACYGISQYIQSCSTNELN